MLPAVGLRRAMGADHFAAAGCFCHSSDSLLANQRMEAGNLLNPQGKHQE
jgi:hypothetical protein